MTKHTQIIKNIDLSEKLADYIAENPEEVKDLPENVSFVTFSSTDLKLNEANKRLIESLKKEGKQVIKAQETQDKENPWKFTSISA
jgi:hypothetical protein